MAGLISSGAIAALGATYALLLLFGLMTLPTADAPIAGPIFVALESLILLLGPLIVVQMGSLHRKATDSQRTFSLLAVAFSAVLAGLTTSVHFVILTVGGNPAVQALDIYQPVLSFQWPSVFYALDILAWDVFFPLTALFAALSLPEHWRVIRNLLLVSSALALTGVAGAFVGDMMLRNIGILGYAVVYPVSCALVARKFWRDRVLVCDDCAGS